MQNVVFVAEARGGHVYLDVYLDDEKVSDGACPLLLNLDQWNELRDLSRKTEWDGIAVLTALEYEETMELA